MWLAVGISGLAWVISLALAYLLGYKWQKITAKIQDIEANLKEVVNRKEKVPTIEAPKSSLIDPTDLAQIAQYERDELTRKLNT